MYVQVTDNQSGELYCFESIVRLKRKRAQLTVDMEGFHMDMTILYIIRYPAIDTYYDTVYWVAKGGEKYVVEHTVRNDGLVVICIYPLRMVEHDTKPISGIVIIASTEQSDICK